MRKQLLKKVRTFFQGYLANFYTAKVKIQVHIWQMSKPSSLHSIAESSILRSLGFYLAKALENVKQGDDMNIFVF